MTVLKRKIYMWCSILCLFTFSLYGEDLLPPMNGYASDFAQRRAGSIVNADIKITVSEEGLYKVSQSELLAAGVSSDALVGSEMRLFNRTWEVAISVSTDGLFGADDFIIFFADTYESSFTESNVYWLGFGAGGLRMAERSGAPIALKDVILSYVHRSTHNPELMYFNNFLPNDSSFDHWFTAFISKTYNENNSFSIWTGERDSSGTAVIKLSLHGGDSYVGTPDHETTVLINGNNIGGLTFDGTTAYDGQLSFSASLLGAESTTVTLNQTQVGNANDRAYLASCSLEFSRPLASLTNETLFFEGEAGAYNYEVTSFVTNNQFYIVDISDVSAPVLLTDYIVNSSTGSYEVSFGDDVIEARRYEIVELAGLHSVDSVEREVFRDLSDATRQAGYIIICPYEFRASAYRLLKHRHLEGLEVAVAPLRDIYNEFSYGIADAGAIKQFLGYAYHHWQTPEPQYVLLAGEGSYDPKGNLGTPSQNILPVHLGPSSWRWTAMDNWFTQVNGQDELIDIAIGRIPVTNNIALNAVTDKIETFEQAITNAPAWGKNATLVADDDASLVFNIASENKVASHLGTAGFSMTKVYMDNPPYGDPAVVRSTILGGFNSGRFLFTFFGHGAVDFWTSEEVWRNSDVSGLNNSVYPIVAMFTCQTGVFQDPDQECIAEMHLKKVGAGAVGCLAPSILSDQLYSEYVADGFVGSLTNAGPVRLGDALMAGMFKLWSDGNPYREELRAYHIFGDPTTLVKAE